MLLRGTAKRFVLFNLHRGLFYYNQENKLQAHGAKKCDWIKPLHLRCTLSLKKWDDGTFIKAQDYINTYKVILSLKEESQEFLENIKSIASSTENKLDFYLLKEDKNFLHKLANIYFSPRKEIEFYHNPLEQNFSGPYRVQKLNKKFIVLENNIHFNKKKRPLVKGIFIDELSTALRLYESGTLDFLRYLETSNIPKYKEIYFSPFLQMDGIFLNPSLNKDLRKNLALSLKFKNLQKIFFSPTLPGCIPLPKFFFKNKIPCYPEGDSFSPPPFSEKFKPLSLYIPAMPSNDHVKMAEWAQNSWKENLNLNIKIENTEPKTFYFKANKGSYRIYRKSISLEEIHCDAAKKALLKQPEFKNYEDNSRDCDTFFNKILESYIWIPLGLPHFANLHAKSYSGYYINMLGYFGLENLKENKK